MMCKIRKDGGAAARLYRRARRSSHAQTEMTIRVNLGRGQAKDTVYTY